MPWSYAEFQSRHHLDDQLNMFSTFNFPDPINDEQYIKYKKNRSKINADTTERYIIPQGIEITEAGLDYLLAKKKEFTRESEGLVSAQKAAGKAKDIDTARFLREEVALNQKYYKATCYAIHLFMINPPGDCTEAKAHVSDELAKYVDQMLHRASLV